MTLSAVGIGFAVSGTSVSASHNVPGSHDGQRTVLTVVTGDTHTITSIWEQSTTTDGGFTLRATHTGSGRTLWVYDKTCGPVEPFAYTVNFTPAATGDNRVITFLADFNTAGDAVRAAGFADSASGTTLVLPTVSAPAPDDLYTVVWNNPVSGGQLRPQSPLQTSGNPTTSAGDVSYMESSTQQWRDSNPTGTRTYAVATGSHEAAIGVIMLVGQYGDLPAGGWGVGAIRMNG